MKSSAHQKLYLTYPVGTSSCSVAHMHSQDKQTTPERPLLLQRESFIGYLYLTTPMLAVPIFQLVSSYLISSQDSTRSTGWRSLNGLFMSSFKSFTTLNVKVITIIRIAMIMIIRMVMIMIIKMLM